MKKNILLILLSVITLHCIHSSQNQIYAESCGVPVVLTASLTGIGTAGLSYGFIILSIVSKQPVIYFSPVVSATALATGIVMHKRGRDQESCKLKAFGMATWIGGTVSLGLFSIALPFSIMYLASNSNPKKNIPNRQELQGLPTITPIVSTHFNGLKFSFRF